MRVIKIMLAGKATIVFGELAFLAQLETATGHILLKHTATIEVNSNN